MTIVLTKKHIIYAVLALSIIGNFVQGYAYYRMRQGIIMMQGYFQDLSGHYKTIATDFVALQIAIASDPQLRPLLERAATKQKEAAAFIEDQIKKNDGTLPPMPQIAPPPPSEQQ